MTIAENFGVDDRGRFYDSVGAMRDVIQNHALQVLGLIGMEPPSGNDPDSIRDQKLDFFKAMRAADPKRYVRGQYDGFLDVEGRRPEVDHRDLRGDASSRSTTGAGAASPSSSARASSCRTRRAK